MTDGSDLSFMTKFLIGALNRIIENFCWFDLLLSYSFKSASAIGKCAPVTGPVQ